MEAIKLCRLDTPIIFIEARINLSRFVVTGCAAKTSATVTFPSLNLISLFRSEERFSRNAETDLVCRLLLEKKKIKKNNVKKTELTRPSISSVLLTVTSYITQFPFLFYSHYFI